MKIKPRDFNQYKNGGYIVQYQDGNMNYQKLYNYMAEEHGIPLFIHEMEEIVRIVLEMNNETREKYTMKQKLSKIESQGMKTAFWAIKYAKEKGEKYIYITEYDEVLGFMKKLTDEECKKMGAELVYEMQNTTESIERGNQLDQVMGEIE